MPHNLNTKKHICSWCKRNWVNYGFGKDHICWVCMEKKHKGLVMEARRQQRAIVAGIAALLVIPLTHEVNAQTNMTAYKDPQGRFAISYPPSWVVTPATNRFEVVAVQFVDNTTGANFNIAIANPVTVGAVTDPRVASDAFTNNIQFGNTLFQNTECTKYKIDGFEACSHISIRDANADLGLVGLVQLQIDSFVNGKLYVFTSTASQSIFDSTLPTFEQMMHSFHASGGVTQ